MILLPLAFAIALAQAAEPPLAPRPSSDTCEIRGRVTDKETGRGVARALVRLHKTGESDDLMTGTDDEGKYEFKALAPGRYSGIVDAGQFRTTYISAPLVPSESMGRPFIVLREGEKADINVALQRALAITIRVVNEWGEPLAGVGVSAYSEPDANGFHRSMSRGTDDRGRVRLFGIEPGRYTVCAASNYISSSADASHVPRERFLRTCYPSAAIEAQAEVVAVERSDIEGLEIRMRRGPTFTISGTVLDASGAKAPGAFVSFAQFDRNSSSSVGSPLDGEGRFTIVNVPPGEYAIEASIGGPDHPEDRRALERGFQPVRVDASDIEGFVLTMAKAVDVTGRVVSEDPAVPLQRPAGYAPLLVLARPAGEQLPMGEGMESAVAGDDRVFVLTGIFGRRMIDVANVPRGWYVKSIRYQGEEIIDVPTEFKTGQDPSELQVILSTHGAVVSGRVLDDRGDPVGGARIFLLPPDPSRRSPFQESSATSSPAGTFQTGPHRAGDYLVVALPRSTALPDTNDKARLAQLMETAERITLGNDEQRTLHLHVVKER
jgi:protocatechuate 3,4-dioxygenase beta subunit